MATWLDACCAMLERRLPERLNTLDDEDRAEHPWWKCKKWSLHILNRTFERFVFVNERCTRSPIALDMEHRRTYLNSTQLRCLNSPITIWKASRAKWSAWSLVFSKRTDRRSSSLRAFFNSRWTSFAKGNERTDRPRVNTARVGLFLVFDMLFPGRPCRTTWWCWFKMSSIRCSASPTRTSNCSLRNLWSSFGTVSVRLECPSADLQIVGLDVFDEYVSPVSAAESFLADAVAKRKDVLMKTVTFLGTIIHNDSISSKQRDGVLHMLGVIGTVLIKKKTFTHQLENMIVQYLFPELQSPTAFLRARACYALRNFSKLEYSSIDNSARALTHLIQCLCNDTSIPVKVEAAMALNMFMSDTETGEKGKAIIVPHLQMIVMRIIEVIRQTEIDDLMIVLQKVVSLFDQELQPIAVQMTSQLVEFFKHVVCSENNASDEGKAEERTIAAMGVLNTLDTIVSCMGEKPEVNQAGREETMGTFVSLASHADRTDCLRDNSSRSSRWNSR